MIHFPAALLDGVAFSASNPARRLKDETVRQHRAGSQNCGGRQNGVFGRVEIEKFHSGYLTLPDR
jgi:hypothetical protein